jgi:dihydroorotase
MLSRAKHLVSLPHPGELGTLRPGAAADVAILRVEPGAVELVDIDGNRRQGERSIRSVRTFIAGRELEPRPMPPRLSWIQLVEPAEDAVSNEPLFGV